MGDHLLGGKAATKHVGPGFDGSEGATRCKGSLQDGMNHDILEWLFLRGVADTMNQHWRVLC